MDTTAIDGMGARLENHRRWFDDSDVGQPLRLESDAPDSAATQAMADAFVAALQKGVTPAFLRGVELRGVPLVGARLTGALLSYARLADVDLSGAVLDDADLLGADLERVRLTDASAARAVLNASFYDCAASQARLAGADLAGATLVRTSLTRATLDGARAARATFTDCDLTGASLRGAALAGAEFMNCDLRGADFSGADLRGVRLHKSLVRDAAGLEHAEVDARLEVFPAQSAPTQDPRWTSGAVVVTRGEFLEGVRTRLWA